jgi:hypothetical protein
MKRFSIILAGVLVVQVAAALALMSNRSDLSAFQAQEPLLAFDAARIDLVAIDETGGGSVTLARRDGKWIVPSQADFPADGAKVEGLLSKLAGLKAGWPAATSDEAAQRFKVTDKDHERRIVLSGGGKQIGAILVGTSPSFRQAHARVDGSSTIHNVAFASHEAGARADEWMSHEMLDIAQDKIASISVGDLNLEGKDGQFTVVGLAQGDKALDAQVRGLVAAVAHPSFDVVQGKGKEALEKLDNPDIQITLKKTDGGQVSYKYKKEGDGAAYVFASSAQDFVFRVAGRTIEPIVQAKRETFIEAKKVEAPRQVKEEPKPVAEEKKAPAEEPKPVAEEKKASEDAPKAATDEAKTSVGEHVVAPANGNGG